MGYDPRAHGAACDICPRKGFCVVPPEGIPENARYIWLGQDPGKQEVKQGRPFVGPTGARTERIWADACKAEGVEIGRNQIFITNSALCMPPQEATDSEARAAMICCRVRLLNELKQAHPDAAILAMGKWAWHQLTGSERGVGKYIGFHVRIQFDEIYREAVEALEAYRAKFVKKQDAAARKAKVPGVRRKHGGR